MLFFLCPASLLSQSNEITATPSAITIVGDATIYNVGQIVVSYNETSSATEKIISPKKSSLKKQKSFAKESFKKEIKEKEDKIRRIAEKIRGDAVDFFIPTDSKQDLTNISLLENCFCAATSANQYQKFSGLVEDPLDIFVKKTGEIYFRKVFYYSINIGLLDFFEIFSVRPPPTTIFFA